MKRSELILKALKQVKNNPYIQGFTWEEEQDIDRLIDEIEAEEHMREFYLEE